MNTKEDRHTHMGIITVALTRYTAELAARAQELPTTKPTYDSNAQYATTLRELWDAAEAAKRWITSP